MADVESIKSPARSPNSKKASGPDPLQAQATKPTKNQVSGKEYDPDLLWYIHGKAYDLSNWVKFHPGGQDAILNAQGRDGTALFESYHFFTDRARNLLSKMTPVEVSPEVLKKYCMDTSEANYFTGPDGKPDPFWETIRARCKKVYDDDPTLTRTSSWSIYLSHMALIWLVQPVIFYFGYMNVTSWISHLSAIAMGLCLWIAGRLGHDAGHYAVCPKKYYSGWFTAISSGFGLTNIGYWQLLHTILHHTYTNMDEADPDLYHYVWFLRDHPNYPWRLMHRLQVHRIYCYFVWAATTAGLLILEPIAMLVLGSATFGTKTRIHKRRHIFWFFLITHLFVFPAVYLGLPLYLTWDPARIGPVVATRVGSFIYFLIGSGFFFGLFSQVNHFSARCVEAATKPTSWATRQIETAANFCMESTFWSILTAGIHIQIEHHLFPSVASDKLGPLIPIVQQTCKEFNVDYKNYDSFSEILSSVHEYMDHLAKPLPEDIAKQGARKRKNSVAVQSS